MGIELKPEHYKTIKLFFSSWPGGDAAINLYREAIKRVLTMGGEIPLNCPEEIGKEFETKPVERAVISMTTPIVTEKKVTEVDSVINKLKSKRNLKK